ncbi:MAG: YdcF family protein [Kiritimatiellia bacterium]
MFALTKYLTWCCMPFSVVLFALAGISLWLMLRRQWKPAIVLVLIDLFLIVAALPVLSIKLGYSLEKKFPPIALKDIPQADAIIVLGGGIGAVTDMVPYPECYMSSDRAVMAVRLWYAKKAPIIIPSGAGAMKSEKLFFEAMGVPSAAILCENASRNTEENALRTFTLLRTLKCQKVLVVTSSWHLPRTMMLFRYPGIEFIPVGCDYEATLARDNAKRAPLWQRLPSPEAMGSSAYYVKEYLGILFYSFKKLPVSAGE